MKTRRFLSVLLAILCVAMLLLPGCGKRPAEGPEVSEMPEPTSAPAEPQSTEVPEPVDEGPDDVAIELVPAGDVIDLYTKDDTDHAALPNAETKTVRLHYRRNDDFSNDSVSGLKYTAIVFASYSSA